jgi:polynucleotide 5'-kinase involved in rRNA processing
MRVSILLFLNLINRNIFTAKEQRNSVPLNIDKKDIRGFIEDLVKNSEEWRAMKLVVLGNGQIGKTTMLKVLKEIVTESTVLCKVVGDE